MDGKFLDTSLFLFCALLSLSSMSALFTALSYEAGIGIMAIGWSILAVSLVLWVIERVYYYKKQIRQAHEDRLSDKLISSMQRQKVYNQGMKALRSLNSVTISVLLSGLLYIFYNFWVVFHSQPTQSLEQLDSLINAYYSSQGIDYKVNNNFEALYRFVMETAILMIIMIVFWLSQLYVYANATARNIIWLSLTIFFLSIFILVQPGMRTDTFIVPSNVHNGYGWYNLPVLQAMGIIPDGKLSYFQQRYYALGMSGALLFYLPGLILTVALIKNLFSKMVEKIYPALGLLVLIALVYVDFMYTGNLRLFSIWVSGWSCLGILSIRNRSNSRKIYRIHM